MKKIILSLMLMSILLFANDVDTQRFRPAFAVNGMIATETNDMMEKYDFSVFLYFHYDKTPFVFNKSDDSTDKIVDNVVYGDLMISFALFSNLEISVDLPMQLFADGDGLSDKDIKSFSLGDLRAGIRLAFIDNKSFGLGVAVNGYFPTGDNFNTTEGYRVEGTLMADIRTKVYKLGFNVGYLFKSDDYTGVNVEMSDEVFYRLGNKFSLSKNIDLLLEAYGAFQVSRPFEKKEETPLEALLGFNFYIGDFKITPAGAVGLVSGVGTPLYRAILGFGYAPRKEQDNDYDKDKILNEFDKCPRKAEDYDNFEDKDGCPDPDNDEDEILDKDDKCPNEPEDQDGFEDEDGCPDPDNDKDGILDTKDKCPNEAEDQDGFEDEDGCPDPDNDKDGVCDPWVSEKSQLEKYKSVCKGSDKCPNNAEDVDGFQDEDGCPDLDNDADGILDKDDKCPNKPENYNGNKDEDGCPDRGKVLVQVDLKTKKIKILKKVYFKTGSSRILRKSYKLLNIVATTIKNNPEIKKVRVEGHTDDRGRDSYNKKLSQRRADSVRNYLINRGIEEDRLISVGYGEEKPMIPYQELIEKSRNRRIKWRVRKQIKRELRKARTNNRRVEFTIVDED